MSSAARDLPADVAAPGLAAPARMRVCHVMSADLWAGAEVQLATTASYLVERPDVRLRTVLFNDGPLAGELRRLGVPVTVIDEHRTSAVRMLASLARVLGDDPPDLVHTHRYKDTVLGAVAARLAGVPALIRTVHGRGEPLRGWERWRFRAYEALEGLTLRLFADRILAVSARMAQGMARGYTAGTVVTVHNGVDLRAVRAIRARDAVRRELGVGPGTALIGTVGRLSAVKGHAHFLRAARLVRQRADASFLFVGDGPLRSDLARLASELGVDRACLFAGARADVYDLVAAMDVFVLPSLDEGIPMALLEAMALGTPVVATAVGGIPEVVSHGESGLLVAAGDERALAEACLELALDRDRGRALAARARRAVEDGFTREGNGRALLDAYRAVTSGRRHARGWLARGARKVGQAAILRAERRRAARIRRDPGALVSALRSARRILIVCHGNIIRSPFAARLAARDVGAGSRVAISSAGLEATPGTPPPPMALRVAARHHVDLAGHAARALSPEAVAASDVVFVMDIAQTRAVASRFPEARAKVFLLASLWPGSALEVRDPVGGDESVFAACYEHIRGCVRPIVRVLRAGSAER